MTLTVDAGISTDLTIQQGQDVRIISGADLSPPSWGSGAFTVQQGGSLSLTDMVVAGSFSVATGGALHLSQVVFAGTNYNFVLAEGAIFTRQGGSEQFSGQCDLPYTTLDDAWRATGSGPGSHTDYGRVTGWYRFTGVGGDAMPLETPGGEHCGSPRSGWLSGWSGEMVGATTAHTTYSGHGRYPAAGEGIVEMTVCFDAGGAYSCSNHAAVGVVRCNGFLLWRLPTLADHPGDLRVYCTVSSGL